MGSLSCALIQSRVQLGIVEPGRATTRTQDYSEMMWYAGGQYIYMRFPEGWPQIWQIVEILPDELRLRHAKRDYVFKRWRDPGI